jgi:LysM repeat protein
MDAHESEGQGTDARSTDPVARPFTGLTSRAPVDPRLATRDAERAEAVRRIRHGVNLTLPMVLAGAMTVTMNLTGALPSADAAPRKPLAKPRSFVRTEIPRPAASAPGVPATNGSSALASVSAAQAAPASYIVAPGDTVSGIAERFGLRTADVLARNGLSWSSRIFPGQTLALAGAAAPAPAAPASRSYTIQRGDTVSGIAGRLGVSVQGILDANGLVRTSIIYPGQTLRIPAGGASVPAIQTVSSVTPVAPPAGPTTPVVDSAPPAASYTVRAGDTVSGIAQRLGVSAAAILQANGLGASTLIYAGRTLTIPGIPAVQDGTAVTPLTAEMAANARIVIQVGRQLGVPDQGIVIALATAMQESSLRNLGFGDRDSIGLFQQRPSTGWGTDAQLTDVSYAARLFYGGPQNPNAGRTRGLLDIPGWRSMSVAQAAQSVQISAYPDAYARWETSARAWLAQLG